MFKTKERIINLTYEMIKDPLVKELYNQCVIHLKEKKVSLSLYFELHHEFGHISKAVDNEGTPVFIKVEKHLFAFVDNKVVYKKAKGKSTYSLIYFEDEENISNKWVRTVGGGLEFTTEALKVKTFSLRSKLFNKKNNLNSKLYRKGTDIDLINTLKDPTEALEFNQHAKDYAFEFTKNFFQAK